LPINTTIDSESDLPIVTKRRMKTSAASSGSEAEHGDHASPPISADHDHIQEEEHGKFGRPPEEKGPAWKAPLSNSFGAISDLMRAGQSEDFLPPPEMQGVIARPQPITYQPIPYQPPILRRY